VLVVAAAWVEVSKQDDSFELDLVQVLVFELEELVMIMLYLVIVVSIQEFDKVLVSEDIV
jgi:hypothetical protein